MRQDARSGKRQKRTDPQAAPRPAGKPVVLQKLADATGLSKQDIINLLAAFTDLIKHDLGKRGPGVFTFPGLFKLKRYERKPIPTKTIRNPFTNEPPTITILGKPGFTYVRALALKALHALIQ